MYVLCTDAVPRVLNPSYYCTLPVSFPGLWICPDQELQAATCLDEAVMATVCCLRELVGRGGGTHLWFRLAFLTPGSRKAVLYDVPSEVRK